MLKSKINKKEQRLLKKNGFLHIRKFFPQNFLKKIFDKIKNNQKIFNSIRVMNPHRNMSVVKKLFKNNEIVNVVKFLLKTRKIHGLQSELFINPPYKSKGHPPHQDDFFLKTGVGNSLNFWIPLVNVNKKNGALVFYKNSHMRGINEKLNSDLLNQKKSRSNVLKKYTTETISCKLGDVIIISNSIFHKSHNNLSKEKRVVIAYGYIKQGSSFVRGKTAKRIPIKVG